MDIKNLVAGDTYRTRLVTIAEKLIDILKQHCGPYAANSVIRTIVRTGVVGEMDKDQSTEVDRYTKDGISIANALRSDDAMVLYLARLLKHVGSSVDRRCHDGTTTSMMFFAALVREFFTLSYDNAGARVATAKQIYSVLEEMTDVINTASFTLDDLVVRYAGVTDRQGVVYALCFHQALLASKGDYALADAIGRVVSTIPVEIHGYYDMNQTPVEIDAPYTVESRDYEIGISANMQTSFYTSRIDALMDLPHADLLVIPGGLMENAPPTDAVITMMVNHPAVMAELEKTPWQNGQTRADRFRTDPRFMLDTYELDADAISDRPLVIMGARAAASTTYFEIRDIWNRVNPDRKVIDVMYSVTGDLEGCYQHGITVMGDKIPLDECLFSGPDQAIIRDVSVVYADNFLRLSRIFPGEGGALHPNYVDPDRNPHYTKILKSIQDKIGREATKHVKSYTSIDQMALISLYRSITCREWYELRIGGTTYETVANRDVVQDAYGAAISAVSDGVVLTGHLKLLQCLQERMHADDVVPNRQLVRTVFAEVCRQVLTAIYHTDPAVFDEKIMGDPKDVYIVPYPDVYGSVQTHVLTDTFMDPAIIYTEFPDDAARLEQLRKIQPIPIQPTAGYLELFRRTRAILPNLVNSVSFIIPPGE